MPQRPVIGIPIGCHTSRGREYVRLPRSYTVALAEAGGAAMLIPPIPDVDGLRRLLSLVDGLLFPGGLDVRLSAYGEEPHPATTVDTALDELELQLAAWAVADEVPTLGICRGQQLLNVALGGSLVQDLPSAGIEHPQSGDARGVLAHRIELTPDSRLAEIFDTTAFDENSHHQAVRDLGRGLRAVGWSSDGVIEALEHTDHPWLLAVQFHPEDLVDSHQPSQRLFKAFVRACLTPPRRSALVPSATSCPN
jgi:putative glutamine amidotransferase